METLESFIARCEAATGLKINQIPQYPSWEAAQDTFPSENLRLVCTSGHGILVYHEHSHQDDDGVDWYNKCLLITHKPGLFPMPLEGATGNLN